jgi:surface protein
MFGLDLNGWDTSKVTTMAEMFEQSGMNGDISSWNVENVQYMNAMFDRASFSGDLSQWKVRSLLNQKLLLILPL